MKNRRGQKRIKGQHEGMREETEMMKRKRVETQRWNIKRNKQQDVEK